MSGMSRGRFADQLQDLPLALQAVADHAAHQLRRLGHRRAMRRIVDAVVALPQLVQALPYRRPCRRRAARPRVVDQPMT